MTELKSPVSSAQALGAYRRELRAEGFSRMQTAKLVRMAAQQMFTELGFLLGADLAEFHRPPPIAEVANKIMADRFVASLGRDHV